MVYYNEFDKQKAAWLRELIKCNAIAPGDVDERSIRDVQPSDLKSYKQCHFFAGIGVWSYALRLAGWDDDRPVWTGSCPCQPFSSAGRRQGTADERHLWPEMFRLTSECRPITVVGEQVASKDGLAWLDDVLTDLENENYSAGAVDTCAAGFGAPHIRPRLYWCGLSNTTGTGLEGSVRARLQGCCNRPSYSDNAVRISNSDGAGCEARQLLSSTAATQGTMHSGIPNATNGFWRDAEWISYRDGKARPVKPGTSPLAHGAPARVVRLRGYGDAIVAPQAAEFIKALMDIVG